MKIVLIMGTKVPLLVLFVFSFPPLTHCEVSHGTQQNRRSCAVQLSGNTKTAGQSTGLKDECKYDELNGSYYQTLSWSTSIKSTAPVSSYLLKVAYGKNKMLCFHFNASVDQFKFDRSVGFRRGLYFRYAVIPQPQQEHWLTNTRLHQSMQCPPKVKLKPLINSYVTPGLNHTFQCEFEVGMVHLGGNVYHHPVHTPEILWYFSSIVESRSRVRTIYSCVSNRTLIRNNSQFEISNDKRTLTIINASLQSEGCYTLVVLNGPPSGDRSKVHFWNHYEVLDETGKLFINRSIIPYRATRKLYDNKGVDAELLVALMAGVGIISITTLAIITHLCLKKRYSEILVPTALRHSSQPARIDLSFKTDKTELALTVPSTKIYISHASDTPKELESILKLVAFFRFNNIDVVVDVCSEAQINTRGGLSRWIPSAMESVDKIVVVLTPKYVDIVTAEKTEQTNSCKVNVEYNFISNILHSSLYHADRLLLITSNKKDLKFPHLFEKEDLYECPMNQTSFVTSNIGINSSSRNIITALIKK